MGAVKQIEYSEFTEEDFIYSFLYNNIYSEFKNKKFSFKKIKEDTNTVTYLLLVDNTKYVIISSKNDLEYGSLKEEYNNLKNLNRKNKDMVLRPQYYYTDGVRELYVTEYLYNIQRIGSNEGKLAIFSSKDNYEPINLRSYDTNIINTALTYNLVRLYDEKRELAPSKIDISNGDFVYCDDWNLKKINFNDSINFMKLTRSREMIRISFKDYLNALRRDLVNNRFSTTQSNPTIITKDFSNFMKRDQIETAISLGLKYKRNLK